MSTHERAALTAQVATLTRERDEAVDAGVKSIRELVAERDETAQQLDLHKRLLLPNMERERDEAREINRKLLDATRVDCDVHHGARRECGQCYDSQGQHLKNVTAERDDALTVIRELRCKLAEAGVEGSPPAGETTIGALTRQRDEARAQVLDLVRARHETQVLHSKALTEARADAARKGEALTRAIRAAEGFMEAVRADSGRAYPWDPWEVESDKARAALADTTSDSWLAEVRATARDEALEDGAKYIDTKQWHPGNAFGAINPSQASAAVRAMKRGGK